MVSRPHRRRAAQGGRLCERRKRALPGGRRIERPRARISGPLGRRGLGRPFCKPSRDADPIKHAGRAYSGSMSPTHRIFLLSPAHCSGKRAGFLLRENARSTLARRLRSTEGATIGEVFTFMSGLYFRGKLAYASTFANPPDEIGRAHV